MLAPRLFSRNSAVLRTSFGWRWIWSVLFIRKIPLIFMFLATVIIYVANFSFPLLVQRGVDAIISKKIDYEIILFATGACASVLMEAIFVNLRTRLLISIRQFLDVRLAKKLFIQLIRARIDMSPETSGDKLNRFEQIEKIRDFSLHTITDMTFDVGSVLVSLALIFYYDFPVGILVTATVLVISILHKRNHSRLRTYADEYYSAARKRWTVLSETASSLMSVKALGLENIRYQKWVKSTYELQAAVQKASNNARALLFRNQLTTNIAMLLVIAIGSLQIIQGRLTIGELLALQMLVGRITGPIINTSELMKQYQEANAAMRDVRDFLQRPRERSTLNPAIRHWSTTAIQARGLTLVYPGAAKAALDGVTFSLPEKGVIAIVGKNGSGKSSLIKILIGLQRQYSGAVLVGGIELRQYHPRWLRRNIGIVDQDTALFSGTIRENICGLGAYSEDRLEWALRFSGAKAMLDGMPAGVESELVEDGRNLSGGQRQRLAIARAVIQEPRIVLFDEPTAFLDAEAAVMLEEKLAIWGRDRLLLLVTHHLAATRNVDRILVLDNGVLVGDSTHDDLLIHCAEYRSMWNHYIRSLEFTLPNDELKRVPDAHDMQQVTVSLPVN